ncbi:MAG: triose-phosphate isomerase [Candidatus Obscuribacterales bacterium]|nr:triose-phosphate isomerase [Candidatus Obscuribacterales bacterium]
MRKRKTIIAGNWKMNKTASEARELATAIAQGLKGKADLPEVVICPPFTGLEAVAQALKGGPAAVGAQNMDYRDEGAFTGEISALMLKDLGVKYVIIGHSERRQFFGETNATVNLRLKAALKHKLIPIVCVGESSDEREEGLTDSVVRRQVAAALADLSDGDVESLVVAYEPVWAIGTGKTCKAEEANRVTALIRATINEYFIGNNKVGDAIPILYGGSVNTSNVEEQLAKSDIDGSLVGGASLTAADFLSLIEEGAKRVKLMPSGA